SSFPTRRSSDLSAKELGVPQSADQFVLQTCLAVLTLTAETPNASAQILVRHTGRDLKFIVSRLTENISRLKLAITFADRSPVQKAHFAVGIIEQRPFRLYNLFG